MMPKDTSHSSERFSWCLWKKKPRIDVEKSKIYISIDDTSHSLTPFRCFALLFSLLYLFYCFTLAIYSFIFFTLLIFYFCLPLLLITSAVILACFTLRYARATMSNAPSITHVGNRICQNKSKTQINNKYICLTKIQLFITNKLLNIQIL